MTVDITQDEMNILNLNGLSIEDVKSDIDYMRSTGLDDNTIRQQYTDTINELRPITKQSVNDTRNIKTWNEKGGIGPFEYASKKAMLYNGTYDNIDNNANFNAVENALNNSSRNSTVDERLQERQNKIDARNQRVNEGTASFFDRTGAAIDRIGNSSFQNQVNAPDDFSVKMSGVNKTSNIDKSKKIGFKESLGNSFIGGEWIPYIGGYVSGSGDKKEREIQQHILNGEPIREDELNYLNHRIQERQEEAVRGYTFGGKVADGFLSSMIRYSLEVATGTWFLKSLGLMPELGAGAGVGEQALYHLGNIAKGGTANALLPTGWNDTYENYQQRLLEKGMEFTDKGETVFKDANEKPAISFLKSLGSTFAAFASEYSGGLIGMPIKGIGAAGEKYIASPMFKYLKAQPKVAKFIDDVLPELSKAYEKFNFLKPEGKNYEFLKDMTRFDGFLEEMGEEAVEDVLNLTLGTGDDKRTLENYAKAIFKTPDEWAVIAGAIALQGATLSVASHTLGNYMKQNGATDDEIIDVMKNLSENDKEKAVEDLIKNGEINLDTTSEQRIEQSIDNLTTTLLDTGKYSNRDQAEKVARLGVNMLGSIADKTGIDIEDLINEDMPNIEQDNRETFVDDKGVVHSGITYNEQEQTIDNRYNELINEISNLPDDYSDEDHINKMITEADLLEKVQSGETLSIDDMEFANDLIEDYENNGNKQFANQLRENLSNIESNSANSTPVAQSSETNTHFQRAITAGATTKDEKLNAIKEWNEKGTDSKYFKKWFGDSKVVDESGKPLVVYHGSRSNFEVFEHKEGLDSDVNSINTKEAFFFVDDDIAADEFAEVQREAQIIRLQAEKHVGSGYNNLKEKQRLDEEIKKQSYNDNIRYKVYLSIQNPIIADFEGKEYETENVDVLILQAKENGNDGVIIKNINDVGGTHTQYAVFNPEQIKSVDNKGTFDKSNPNIYFQRATSNNNNVVDLTNDFEKTPSIDEVKAYINEIVENGTKFATLSPYWFVDIKKESSNKKQKRITDKLLNKGNFLKLNKPADNRHKKYVMSLEKLLANAEYAGEKENTKKDKKPNVEKYHYFKTDVKIGNKIYQLIFDTEEYKNSPQTAQHDNRVLNPQSEDNNIINDNVKNFKDDTENDKSSSEYSANTRGLELSKEDTNSINDNAEKINPKTVHLYNIKEIKNPKMYFQSAYHGSPHKFDEFSLDAIGTGEGAQAHGWGLYFAANKEISHGYMERLSEGEWRYKGKRLAGGEIFFYKSIKEDKQGTINLIQNRIDETQAKLKNKQKELKETKSPIFSDFYKDEIKSLKTEIEYQKNNLKKIKSIDVSKIEFKAEGQLFEVDIPDVDEMLDEDKDLIHQSNKVQRAIEKIYSDAMASNNVKLTNAIGITGKETYSGFLEYFGSDKKASEFLNSYGIKGITYDGRQDGRCYVVFDDKAIQVLKKYYQKQRKMFIDNNRAEEISNRLVQVKGSFIPAENLVKLFKDADESTIVHEFAHWWLEKLVKHSEGNEELQEDLKEIRKFVKNNGEEFTDEQHERFARGFEVYIRTGSAKTNRLKKLFEDFKNALLSLYDSIKSLGFEESEIPEINNLFDRLLTTENQRIQAAVFDRCNTIQSQIEEIRTNQEKELSEIDEIEKNNLERNLQDTRKKQQVEEYLNLADKASSRVPKSVKEYSKRFRQVCYEILSAALNHKYSIKYLQMTLAQNNAKAENLRQELMEVDDDITTLGGMQSNWYEFFGDTGVNYNNDEVDGDAKLVEQALDRIDNNNFAPPESYPGEEIIGKFMGAFDYLSGKVLSLRGENKDAAFEALSELFSGRKFGNLISLNQLPQDVMTEISNRMDEISKTYIEQKTNEKNKYAIPNVSLSTQLRTYVTHKLHNTKSYDPIEKKYIRLSSVNRLFSLLPLVNNSLTAKEVVRTINAHAIKQLENRQKYILHKEIQKQIKINSKLIKVGALKQGKFDWKTNTVFSELQQMNHLTKEDARKEYLRLIDADAAVIGEERDNINQDATNDIKAPTDFQGILKVKFLEYKSNNAKDLNLSATRSLLEDILQLKFEGRRAKNEQDLKKALTRYDYKNNLIEIMDKHRDNNIAKYLARWTAGDTIFTSEGTLANWESLLTGIFDKATAEKYSLLKSEADVEVYAHRKSLEFYKKAMDIYHLNRSTDGLKNKIRNVWDRALDFDNIQPLVDLFRKYDETTYPFKQATWNKDTGEFVETTIELNHSQLITLYAWSLNPNLKERLITQFVGEDVSNGAEKLNELMFAKLSEQDKLFAWAMVDTCDTMYEDTNEVFIRTTGLSLPRVDNYIPSKTERIGSDLDMMHETMLRSTNPSFIKQRKNCSRIKMEPISPLEIILPHINKTARYVVMSEKVNFFNRIFQSPDIKAKIIEIYGKKSGEKIHRILLNQLATSTYDNYAKSITVGKNLIDTVASNYITSKIGGNLKVMFSQLTSMVNYCENMPFGMWSKGFADALAHPKKTVDFMFKNCEYLQARLAGNSQNEIISMVTNNSDKFRALRNFCTSNTKYGDIIAIMFGGKPYVDYLISKGMSQEEAFTKFTEDTLRSQQSGHNSATSAWQKQVAQHAVTRMIFAFNNTNFQYERKFVDAMTNLAKSDVSKEEFMKSFLIYKVFNPILFTSFLSDLSLLILFQNMFGGGDDDPLASFGSDIINAILLSNWKAYGVLGLIANSIVSAVSAKVSGGMYFEEKLPLISDFETSINKLLKGKKLELGDYIEMIAGAGDYSTGVATTRLYNATGGLGDITQGDIGTGLLRIIGYGKYRASLGATGKPQEKKKK